MIEQPKAGLRVRVTRLGDTEGMIIAPRHLLCRSVGVVGTIAGYVPGHGGDVWFVRHDGSGEVGAYCTDEMDELQQVTA